MKESSKIFRPTLPWSVLVVGIFLSLAISAYVYWNEKREAQFRFDNEVEQIQNKVRNRFERYEGFLVQVRGFLANSQTMSQQVFHEYSESIEIQERYPGIQGIGYAVRIPAEQLEKHISEIRSTGRPEYRVWPESPREEYFSILYLEPVNWRNKRAIGFDMYSEPVRREAMMRARDSGRSALSSKVVLVQETNESPQAGFNFYVPVYKKGLPASTVEERRKALLGFVYSPFRAKDLFNAIFPDKHPIVDFEIFDGSSMDQESLIFDLDGELQTQQRMNRAAFSTIRKIDLGQNTYTIAFVSLPKLHSTLAMNIHWIVGLFGTFLSILFFWIISKRRADRDLRIELDERQRVKDKFENLARTFDTALSSSPDFSYIFDTDHRFTYVNKPLLHLWGKTLDEVRGKNFADLGYPQELVELHKSQLDQVLTTKNKVVGENAYTNFEGKTGYYEYIFVPIFGSNDQIYAISGTTRDITERKRFEKERAEQDTIARQKAENALAQSQKNLIQEYHKFESIFVDSPASMALLRGPTFIFEKVNPKYSELIGKRDIVGKTLEEALPELIGQPFHDLMKKVFETGETFIGKEVLAKLIRRQGGEPEVTYFDFTYSRVLDGEGRPYGIYIHAADITEKVLARKQSETLLSDLKEAVRARDEFLSIASHELKTPLTSLGIQAQVYARAIKNNDRNVYTPQKVHDLVNLVNKQMIRLNRLIDDMLDVSRIRTGKLNIEKERFDLCDLVEEVLQKLESQFSAAGLIVPQFHRCENTAGNWDKLRIEQVLVNLLTNAMRYGRGKPILIDVQPHEREVLLSVKDEGIGIASEALEKIFNRFERSVNANEVSGLGLGLFITKQIVEAHQGKIWVESEIGKGSAFFVRFPKNVDENNEVFNVK